MPDPVPPLRLVLIAPPTATVPPSSLGGLDQVRWLAQGLAERGHQVTLIGAGMSGFQAERYTVVDTDDLDELRSTRPDPELADAWHAKTAGEALAALEVDAVSDHTLTGYRPTGRDRMPPTAWTLYQTPPPPLPGERHRAVLPPQLGLVACSLHQQRPATHLPWWDVVHPGVPVAEHPPSARHDGPCLYLGPLAPGRVDRAGIALDAAHAAGRPVTLAGTGPAPDRDTVAALRRQLRRGDRLRPAVTLAERWALLERASCLLAPAELDEPYSLAVVEALAYGTPVVGLADTVVAELVGHQQSGVLVHHPRDLGTAVRKAVALDPATIRRHAGRFDVAVMVAGYERLFGERVLAGAPR